MPSMSFSLTYRYSNLLLFKSPKKRTPLLCHNFKIQNQCKNFNEPEFTRDKKLLKDLSTWGIGGPCNYFTQVYNQPQLSSVLRYCRESCIRFHIVGKGSNCLFDDLGFDGCVIQNRIEFLDKIEPGVYRVGSGFGFNRLGLLCSNEGSGGLEFAAGIPGTVGGATFMNAGANGQETANAIESVEIVTVEGKYERLYREYLEFGYRSSPFQEMKSLAAIVAVTFRLQESRSAKSRQQQYLERRRLTQPLREKTAGSVFRNPPDVNFTAAELIEKAGLKGFRLGGAMVSDIHANFFVNHDGATSQNMLDLISLVKDKVHQKFGIKLREEVSYVHPYCERLEYM